MRSIAKAVVAISVATMAVVGCGGGKSSAAKTAAACNDWGRVVELDNSDVSGSIDFYKQMTDLYKHVEGEVPSSLKLDLKVLVADEEQLVKNGTDSSQQADAAQAASDHVDTVLGALCDNQ